MPKRFPEGGQARSVRSTTMPSYPAPKRQRPSYHDYSFKCFCKIKRITAIRIALQKKSLACLDLAVVTDNRWWEKSIKLQMIRCLPPFCAEYLTPEDTAFHPLSLLGMFFEEFHVHLQKLFHVFLALHEVFVAQIYSVFERLFSTSIYAKESRPLMRRAIVGYLRTACFLRVFHAADRNRFVHVYQLLLLILYSYFPFDSDLAVAMLQTLCAHDAVKPYVLVLTDDKTLEFLLRRARDKRFGFWGLWRGGGHMSERFNPVAVLFGSLGRNELARTLVRYGFTYAADGTVYEERCQELAQVRHQDMYIVNPKHMWQLVQRHPCSRMLMILDIFLTFVHFNDDIDKVSTLLCISRSLPHPYVTPAEMFHNLVNVLQPTFHQKFVKICRRYSSEEIYDDDYKVLKPRRLAHLSRCVIRKALADNFRLPDGIDELKLEDKLKDYLLLER